MGEYYSKAKPGHPSSFYVFVVMLSLASISMVLFTELAQAAPTAAECRAERKAAVNACKTVIYGRNPTAACCLRARVSHVECICPAVTPKLAALVDVNRAVRLVESCGRAVPHHFKCGSITTP